MIESMMKQLSLFKDYTMALFRHPFSHTFYVYALYYPKIHSALVDCDVDKGTHCHTPYPCPLG